MARPGTKIVITDESEKGAQVYGRLIPGFSGLFRGRGEAVIPPVALVPQEVEEIRVDTAWRGYGYCLEFRKGHELSELADAA